ncbi:hypothetical protein [Cellulosilyticum ruminicola]|uniref:hypothetical protein n=1 Tax=Cellulosilyticum ruminicola TaxID=425254 RepID=UPI0012EDC02E|nr:hypothetical protein [Cellulosilyticum ruminicola]
MKLSRNEVIQLAKSLKVKGGVGTKFVALSGLKNDALYQTLRQGEKLMKNI